MKSLSLTYIHAVGEIFIGIDDGLVKAVQVDRLVLAAAVHRLKCKKYNLKIFYLKIKCKKVNLKIQSFVING